MHKPPATMRGMFSEIGFDQDIGAWNPPTSTKIAGCHNSAPPSPTRTSVVGRSTA